MENLAKTQAEIGQTIQKIISNYKKDSADRKNLAYYQERLRRLDEQWNLFDTNDTNIRDLHKTALDHDYFQKDYYQEIMKLYKEYRSHFEEEIQLLVPSTSQKDKTTPHLEQKNDASEAALEDNRNRSPNAEPNNIELIREVRRQKATMTALDRLLRTIVDDIREEPKSNAYHQQRIITIEEYWTKITNLHMDIMSHNVAAIDYNEEHFFELEIQYQDVLIALKEKVVSVPQYLSNTSQIKLPKITIPKFDGDYAKWRQFIDLFEQMVHRQPISNCEKMWYLKTNISGEAEKLLRHLTLSEDNYASAYKILQDRYENSRLLTAALINKLLNQPSFANDTPSATALKTMHDTTQECLMGLENLGVSTTSWDPLLLHILLKRTDRTTHSLYEQSLKNPKVLQPVKEFLTFLELRFQSLEALGTKGRRPDERNKQSHSSLTSIIDSNPKCAACNGLHALYQCQSFLKMAPRDRLNVVYKHNMCSNCLRAGHYASKCTLRGCKKCTKKHNTLVHLESAPNNESSNKTPSTSSTDKKSNINIPQTVNTKPIEGSVSLTTSTYSDRQRKSVLLGTSRVKLISPIGDEIECRAILDSGSQINIISQRIAKKLNITPTFAPAYIQGIGQGKQCTNKRINVKLQSKVTGFSTRLEALILDHIIAPQPSQSLDISKWAIPHNIQLADPDFHNPDRIDLLLGAELFFQLLSIGQIKLGPNLPTLQNTVFGWIIAGKVDQASAPAAACGICSEDVELNKAIERFWEVEEVEKPHQINLTLAQKQCETHFAQTVRRDSTGRFEVSLPFSGNPASLGQSRDIAFRRFISVERKLSKDDDLRQQYISFMQEYINLGHMEEIDEKSIVSPHYFLPHHSVLKPDSSTTKLRVVFDASAKTSTNIALNDILHIGPTLQEDLFSILLRFRIPRFVFTADIQKMYRQIAVQENDMKYQLIWWRTDPRLTLKCYKLRTVTYGTSSAPYLAMKCLQKLAEESGSKYPLGAQILHRDFYVDDVMTGSDSIGVARNMQAQLTAVLKEAGFHLRKWCANHPQLLRDIPLIDQEVQLDFTNEKDSSIKTLGLTWMPKSDLFGIKSNSVSNNKITKRSVASDIARLFDPLGILAPVIVTAKIFLQQLWELKLDWDAALPAEHHTKWTTFRNSLPILSQITFPRHVYANEIPKTKQLHIFADASEKAYGAAIYIRSTTNNGRIIVRLLCSKSRVAPTKKITLPRLELCAAKVAAELADRVKKCLQFENTPAYFWTDSEIVLAWINSTSTNFQTFVGNRIAAIQRLSLSQQWRHVKSKENPADPLSRGILPGSLSSCNLWFYGPPFLHGNEAIWPAPFRENSECQLEKKRVALSATGSNDDEPSFIYTINHKGSFRKLQRIIAYVLRFVKNTKRTPNDRPKHLFTTCRELEEALQVIMRAIQEDEFKEDLAQLRKRENVNKKSCLSSLTPIMDNQGIMRVGGRLEQSSLSYNAKHPILLPYADPITKLLMTTLHKENLHTGPQALLADTRQRFWPLKGKTIARSIVQHCVTCAKAKPKMLAQFMGNLPSTRIQPARPFINSGVDFCGPLWIHHKIRGKRPHKAYLAVFCCFATKAVHLEIVGDLSTEAFVGALKRFIGRRGHCQKLYCDNATNFVGARNQLQELTANIYSQKAKENISGACSKKGIEFHFIPPRAPHFGGLWEAAVKSAKHLLLKTTSAGSLTYEELETLMIEIEAILNSRPLTPMSNDPTDLTVLTPGHFLIGEPLTSTVDVNARELKASLLTRWNLVSHLKHEFWRRWSREYLNELQHRYKWKERCENINPGSIVIIQDDNLPALKWSLGRITQTHKGDDGLVRVADVKTATGILRRPIHKLAPLPCDENNDTIRFNSAEDPQESPSINLSKKQNNEDSIKDRRDKEENASRPKRVRRASSSSIVSLLLTCLIVPIIQASNITLQQFDPKPGIYFENIGTTSVISTEWNVVVYYDLRPYWMELTALSNSTNALEHLCQQMKQKSTCVSITKQFKAIEDELQIDNSFFATRRQKRGAFDLIGNVANSLFGVLDSKYAEQMSKTIDVINKNEGHLLALIKNQTSIIDSTINVLKRDHSEAERKFKEIDNQVNQLINRINHTGEDSYELKINQFFISLSIQLSLIVMNLQKTQATIIDVLTDIHHGRISPILVTPQQISRELTIIKEHLPTSLRLPTDQRDLIQIYKTMTAASRIVKNHVIIKINIPLVNVERFDLFKMIPIPAVTNGTLIAIQPCSVYIALNSHKDHYYTITPEELLSCMSTENQNYLCHQSHPLYHKIGTICSCEASLINNTPYDKCNIQRVENSPVWVQLTNPNQWIYAVKEPIIANALCREEITPLTLNNSGLIKIPPDCVIKHDLLTIQGLHTYPSSIRTSYQKLNDLANINIPMHSTSMINNSTSYKIQREQLQLLTELVSSQMQQEALTILQPSNTHQLSIGYIALILAIIIICSLIFKYWKNYKHRKPIPAPRPLKALDFSINVDSDIEQVQRGGEC